MSNELINQREGRDSNYSVDEPDFRVDSIQIISHDENRLFGRQTEVEPDNVSIVLENHNNLSFPIKCEEIEIGGINITLFQDEYLHPNIKRDALEIQKLGSWYSKGYRTLEQVELVNNPQFETSISAILRNLGVEYDENNRVYPVGLMESGSTDMTFSIFSGKTGEISYAKYSVIP